MSNELESALLAILPEGSKVDAGGYCPVQAMIDLPDGSRLYFRARDCVSVEAWPPGHTGGERDYCDLPEEGGAYLVDPIPWNDGAYAGYIPDADVVAIVGEHVALFLASRVSP